VVQATPTDTDTVPASLPVDLRQIPTTVHPITTQQPALMQQQQHSQQQQLTQQQQQQQAPLHAGRAGVIPLSRTPIEPKLLGHLQGSDRQPLGDLSALLAPPGPGPDQPLLADPARSPGRGGITSPGPEPSWAGSHQGLAVQEQQQHRSSPVRGAEPAGRDTPGSSLL